MHRKINKQQLEYIRRYILKNRFYKFTGFLKISLGIGAVLLIGVVFNYKKMIREKMIERESAYMEKEERMGENFKKGINIDAEDSIDGKLYLLKEDRIEAKDKLTGLWKTYTLPIPGKKITVSKDLIAILSHKDEIHLYDKKFKVPELFYGNKKSDVFQTIESAEEIFSIGDRIIVQGKSGLDSYDIKTHSWAGSPFENATRINSSQKIGGYHIFATDYGVAYYDGKDMKEKELGEILDISIKSKDEIYVLNKNGELISMDIKGNSFALVIPDTSYSGEKIKHINKSETLIFIQDIKGNFYSYSIKERKWKKLQENIDTFYLSGNMLLTLSRGRGKIYDPASGEEIRDVNEKILKAYPQKDKFVIIGEENGKNTLYELFKSEEKYLIGAGVYQGSLREVEEYYYHQNKIFAFKSGNPIQYYDYQTREWKNTGLIQKGEVTRIRENITGLYAVTDAGDLLKYDNTFEKIAVGIKTFDFREGILYVLNSEGALLKDGKEFMFSGKSPYPFSEIIGVSEGKDEKGISKVFAAFNKGAAEYDPAKGNWENHLAFNSAAEKVLFYQEKIYAYKDDKIQFSDLKGKKTEEIKLGKKILSLKVNKEGVWALSEDEKGNYIHLEKEGYKTVPLSQGVRVGNIEDIKDAEEYKGTLYMAYGKNLYQYKNSLWSIKQEFSREIEKLEKNNEVLAVETGNELYVLNSDEGQLEKVAENHESFALLESYLAVKTREALVLTDLKNKTVREYLKGKFKPSGKIKSVHMKEKNLYITDEENFWKYDTSTFSWSKLPIGKRIKEIFEEKGLYYSSGKGIKLADYSFNETKLTEMPIEDFWVSSKQDLIYKNRDVLYQNDRTIFKATKLPYNSEGVKEYLVNKGHLYAILNDGYARYDLVERKWSPFYRGEIKKYEVHPEGVYFLKNNGIYKDEEEMLRRNSIKDFTVFNNEIICLEGDKLKSKSGYFQEKSMLKSSEIDSFAENERYYVFGSREGLSIYDKEKHSWKNIPNFSQKKKIFFREGDIYCISEGSIKIYGTDAKEKYNKGFSWEIIDFVASDRKMLVLTGRFEARKISYYDGSSWTEVSTNYVPFKPEDIKDIYVYKGKPYFLTEQGVFVKDGEWRTLKKGNYSGYRLEEYSGILALIGKEKIISVEGQSEFSIENYSYNIKNGREYFLKNSTVYGEGKNKTQKDILENIQYSFNKDNKYYYISTKGIAVYNLSNHTWIERRESIGTVNSDFLNGDTIELSTSEGLYVINLISLDIEKYLESKNITSSNGKYAIAIEGKEYLYERKGRGFVKAEEYINRDIKKIEAVDYKSDNLYLYSNGSAYLYDSSKNVFKKTDQQIPADIINLGDYKGKSYILGKGGILKYKEDIFKINAYSKSENHFYIADKNGINDLSDLNSNYNLYSTLKGVYSSYGDTHFTSSGTYKQYRNLGVYIKIDDDTRRRMRQDDRFFVQDGNSIFINEQEIKIGKKGLLDLLSSTQFLSSYEDDAGKTEEEFKEDEKIEELLNVQKDLIFFKTSYGSYSYSISEKKVRKAAYKEKILGEKNLKLDYYADIRGIFVKENELTVIGTEDHIIIDTKTGKQKKSPYTKEELEGWENSFQENEIIGVKKQKGYFIGNNIKSINFNQNFYGIKPKVQVNRENSGKLNVSLKQRETGSELLITPEGKNEDALSDGKLKINIPKKMILENDGTVTFIYNNPKEAKKKERVYHYLSNGNIKVTKNKEEFMSQLKNAGFKEDDIVSITNNPNEEIYFATPEIIYDRNYNIIYKWRGISKINVKNGNLMIENNLGEIYSLKSGKIQKRNEKLDPERTVSFDGSQWSNIPYQGIYLELFKRFKDKEAFKNGSLIFEQYESISLPEKNEEGFIFTNEGIQFSFQTKNYKLLEFKRNHYPAMPGEYFKDSKTLSKGRELFPIGGSYKRDDIMQIASDSERIYLLTRENIWLLKNGNLQNIEKTGTEIKKIEDKIVLYENGKSFIFGQNGKIEAEADGRLRNQVILSNEGAANKIQPLSSEKINYQGLKDSEIIKDGYFVFDNLINAFYHQGLVLRPYNNKLVVSSSKNLGNIIQHERKIESLFEEKGKLILRDSEKRFYEYSGNTLKENWDINETKDIHHDERGNITLTYSGGESKIYYKGIQKNDIIYNDFKNINSIKNTLYLVNPEIVFQAEIKGNIISFNGDTGRELLQSKEKYKGKIVEIDENNFKVYPVENPGIGWKLGAIDPKDIWIKNKSGVYNFTFDTYKALSSDQKYSTDGKYIFQNEKRTYLNPEPRKIEDLENEEGNLYILTSKGVLNKEFKLGKIWESPFKKVVFDLKDKKIKTFEKDVPYINYSGENIYAEAGKLSLDKVAGFITNTSHGKQSFYFASEKGIVMREEKNETYSEDKVQDIQYEGQKIYTENTKNLKNRVTLKRDKIIQNRDYSGQLLAYGENYPKEIIAADSRSFIWDNPASYLIEGKGESSNKEGEIWTAGKVPKFYTMKKDKNLQEIFIDGEVYLYKDKAFYSNAEEKIKNIVPHASFPETISLSFTNGKWSSKILEEKIELEGVKNENIFVKNRFNFDYISSFDKKGNFFSDRYTWDIKVPKLIRSFDSDIIQTKQLSGNVYLKLVDGWKNTEGKTVEKVSAAKDNKWEWNFNFLKEKLEFKNHLASDTFRKMENGKFQDDIPLAVKSTKGEFHISTPEGRIVYNTNKGLEFKEFLNEEKGIEKLYRDKQTNRITTQKPELYKGIDVIDNYRKSGLHYWIQKNGILIIKE